MSRGDKSSYSAQQKRQARHIEESYERKGVPEDEAAARAWATINRQSGGGERSGSGRRKPEAAKKTARKASARRAARTRAGNPAHRGSLTAGRSRGAGSKTARTRSATRRA